jgi:hypothetical protein
VRGCIGAISLNYGRRIPIFRGRLRAPPGRTGHLGLPPRPWPSERALAHRVSAMLGNLTPRPAGPATKIGTPPDAVATPNALS